MGETILQAGVSSTLETPPNENCHTCKEELLSKMQCSNVHVILRRVWHLPEKPNGDHHQASKQPMPLHPQPSQHPLSLPIQRLF
jgi:hypothetical protein